MTKRTLSKPTLEDVALGETEFNDEYGPMEWLLGELFHQFPSNIKLEQIALKTKVLNTLYSTQIRAVNVVAKHILDLSIDADLALGNPKVVDRIAKVRIGDKVRNNFSFASKYCSWHNEDAFPIYDSRVEACLIHYSKQDGFARIPEHYEYCQYVDIVKAFQTYYALTSCSFKQLDKLLWLRGEQLLGR
jgi:hypothetical protein